MLVQLAIRDIVLIEQANVPLAAGLCILSGETGAGKSILLDALGLALGQRAEARLVRHGAEQGVVTAEFLIRGAPHVKDYIAELGLVYEDDTLIIRRTLSADGKSKSLVNDQPISVTALKALGEMLVEIHGQHDQRGLMDASTHRTLLDDFAGHRADCRKLSQAYQTWRAREAELMQVKADVAKAAADEEYLRHNLAELQDINPETNEEQALADKRQFMMQGEKRIATIQSALDELQQGKRPAPEVIHNALRLLSRSPALDAASCEAPLAMLERAATELNEAIAALHRIAEESQFSPTELDRIEERLFALRGLARKHHTDVGSLAALMEEMRAKLKRLENQNVELSALEKAVADARADYVAQAEALSAKRQKAAAKLEKAVMAELQGLKMAATRVTVQVEQLPEAAWHGEGIDKVTFLAATNPGSAVAPLAKIASGGELSRFMLALKVAMRAVRSAGTLIFDEIDTGTGGATADAIGKRLAQLGETSQVVVVTHLPQVAAYGSHHLRISKAADKKTTRTQVELLSKDERREELARMLAGADITPEARAAAEKLIMG